LLPFTISLHSSFWLVASGRERETAWVSTAGLLIAFVLHTIFIQLGHTAGAAGAFVAAEVCLAGLLWWVAFIRSGRFSLK
jgi:O-antigen/teichoic acid export membrane protein